MTNPRTSDVRGNSFGQLRGLNRGIRGRVSSRGRLPVRGTAS